MGYRALPAADAFWRQSNQMGVQNTDLAKAARRPPSARGSGASRPDRPRHATERLAWMYPDGPKALPPELEG